MGSVILRKLVETYEDDKTEDEDGGRPKFPPRPCPTPNIVTTQFSCQFRNSGRETATSSS